MFSGPQGLVTHLKDPSWKFMSKLQYHYVSSPKGGLVLEHIIILVIYVIISYVDPYHFKWSNGTKYRNFRGHVDQTLLFWQYFKNHTNFI